MKRNEPEGGHEELKEESERKRKIANELQSMTYRNFRDECTNLDLVNSARENLRVVQEDFTFSKAIRVFLQFAEACRSGLPAILFSKESHGLCPIIHDLLTKKKGRNLKKAQKSLFYPLSDPYWDFMPNITINLQEDPKVTKNKNHIKLELPDGRVIECDKKQYVTFEVIWNIPSDKTIVAYANMEQSMKD